MADTDLILLDQVGKDYPMMNDHGGRFRTLWSLLVKKTDYPKFPALVDVSFVLRRGESLGLIGENGAGKSTLLKLIAGVVKPSKGRVVVNGRIGALLELGAGFHPDYSGRENIYLSAALSGLGRENLKEKINSIIEFADIGEHIDQPIKHYSSGMVVRLGFAIVTAMRPEVLITDEVLAVGDESFQKKCIRWIEDFLEGGGTLLLCAHSMFHIQKLCKKAIWVHHGHVREYGDSGEVTRNYLAYHEEKSRPPAADKTKLTVGEGGVYAIQELHCQAVGGDDAGTVSIGGAIRISGTVHSPDGRTPAVTIGVIRADGTPVYGLVSDSEGYKLKCIHDHLYGFSLRFENLPLLPGRYRILAHAMDPEGLRLFDTAEAMFDVGGQTLEQGFCRLEHHWDDYATDRG